MQHHNYILYIVYGETRTGTTTTSWVSVVFVVTVLVTLQIVEEEKSSMGISAVGYERVTWQSNRLSLLHGSVFACIRV